MSEECRRLLIFGYDLYAIYIRRWDLLSKLSVDFAHGFFEDSSLPDGIFTLSELFACKQSYERENMVTYILYVL